MGLIQQVGMCLILFIEGRMRTHTRVPKPHKPRITLWITRSVALDTVRHKDNNRLTSLICIAQISSLIPWSLDM